MATKDDILTQFPYMAWAVNHPELGKILTQAVDEGRDETWIQAKLLGTNWWRTTEPARREWVKVMNQDPARGRDLINTVALTVRQKAARLGIQRMTHAQHVYVARTALANGWVDMDTLSPVGENFDKAIMAYGKIEHFTGGFAGERSGGLIAAMMDKVEALATEFMVPTNHRQRFSWAQQMLLGDMDEEAVVEYFRDKAQSYYPYLKEALDQGMTARQYFEPYRQRVAEILEISPDAVDLQSSKYYKIARTRTDDNKVRPMTLSEAEEFARRMPEWRKTRNANQAAGTLAARLIERMGGADFG